MALLGRAALAMWWEVAPHALAGFEHWHAHEHFPERLAIPGFRRATRWHAAQGGPGVFVLYELDDHAVLSSPAYLARLNAPSPWSVRMMPLHAGMVRSQCHVLASHGASTACHAMTLRLSPAPGQAEALRTALQAIGEQVPGQPGLVGLHLLRHEAPPIAQTQEQRIRALPDRFADWVLVVCGYDAAALQFFVARDLGDTALAGLGAALGTERAAYGLRYSATPPDMR